MNTDLLDSDIAEFKKMKESVRASIDYAQHGADLNGSTKNIEARTTLDNMKVLLRLASCVSPLISMIDILWKEMENEKNPDSQV